MSPKQPQNPLRIKAHLMRVLERELNRYEIFTRARPLAALIRAYIERPAKLLRPTLLLETARSYGADIDHNLLELAAATELFHTAALLHDDRIDGPAGSEPEMRSGAAHASGCGAEPADRQTALQVLAGDLLHSIAHGVLVNAVLEGGLPPVVLEIVREVCADTVVGQTSELLATSPAGELHSLAELYELYDMKTGRYTFGAPLLIGGVCGGAPDGDLKTLQAMARPLGRAYQLQDDLLDIERLLGGGARPSTPFGSPTPSAPPAAWELNLLRVYLAECGKPPLPAVPTTTPAGLRGLVELTALRAFVAPRIEALVTEAQAAARKLSLSDNSRRRLFECAGRNIQAVCRAPAPAPAPGAGAGESP